MKKMLGIVLVAALAAAVVGCCKCSKKDAAVPATGATCDATCTCANKALCASGKCDCKCAKCQAAKAAATAATNAAATAAAAIPAVK